MEITREIKDRMVSLPKSIFDEDTRIYGEYTWARGHPIISVSSRRKSNSVPLKVVKGNLQLSGEIIDRLKLENALKFVSYEGINIGDNNAELWNPRHYDSYIIEASRDSANKDFFNQLMRDIGTY